ncbi:hypothetical protein NEF87_003368 [Candidatus Lokiarchaeum ossiferum]|uniref:N-acetyltransferase domain-containing protein n=1 Tax=Candidatus Lokiarchaeum ossiferum TaxID=2951803 RepID=A0ABY6HU79_9ARCH|nr:hypothetical protein NEF87_003368 [Candidatus Lokiarchaeum sp. B-35]
MDFTENEFFRKLAKSWAKFFSIPLENFLDPEISIIEEPDLKKTNAFNFWTFDKKRIIQVAPSFYKKILKMNDNNPLEQSISMEDFISKMESEGFQKDDLIYIYHLKPGELKRKPLFDEYTFRFLKLKDQFILKRLQFACSKFEVKNSWVKITHPEVLGCFHGKKLVAVSSMVNFGDAKDIGVLTHPKFRRKGLGRLLISELCKKALRKNELLLYRCHDGNLGSISVARSLGFTKFFEEVTFSARTEK